MIEEISLDEFDSLNIVRLGYLPEKQWFKSTAIKIAGTVIKDPVDKDWAYVIVAEEEDGAYRYIKGESSLASQGEAETKIYSEMFSLEVAESFNEELYSEAVEEQTEKAEPNLIIVSIDDEVKKYFKNNPEKLYELSPRKFEELVAAILKDLGFEAELTQATRDGGRDIIAYVRSAVGNYLTHIECKRYAAENKVGVGIVREVIGVHHLRKAAKSVIITTSFFTPDAVREAEIMEGQVSLKDFNDLKIWLQAY